LQIYVIAVSNFSLQKDRSMVQVICIYVYDGTMNL